MTKRTTRTWPPSGYPQLAAVEQGASVIAATPPEPVYLTVSAKLHNLGLRKTTAHLQVFDIATKAAQWMLRDVQCHDPLKLFAPYRKRNSTSYHTDRIANALGQRYRARIRSRFTLNSSVFVGLCAHIANDISGWLQRVTEADQKGLLTRYHECSEYVVPFGKHRGQALKALPRDVVFGFAFLQSTKAECEQALRYLDALLNDLPEEADLREEAENYCLPSGRRKGKPLGTMRAQTWRRLRLLTERDLNRMDQIEHIRKVAQDFLQFTPPSFPSKHSGLLSAKQRAEAQAAYLQALEDYAALPEADDDEAEGFLVANERQLFQALQRQAYTATNQPRYVTLQWDRADGAMRSRDVALLFDRRSRKYLFLAHILHTESRHRRPMPITGDVVDVNNPEQSFHGRTKPSVAMLYELEFDTHQRKLLDRARHEAELWKSEGKFSGAVRSAKLQAHYDQQQDSWWFGVMIAIGLKPKQYIQPEHILSVHINPSKGWQIGVFRLDGTLIETFQLDELRIAQLLENQHPQQQAQLKPNQRTAKERAHRLADALMILCRQYQALCAIENISYRSAAPGPYQMKPQDGNSRSIIEYVKYKLPLSELWEPLDIRGVAPKRSCGRCGYRHAQAAGKAGLFSCTNCGHQEPAAVNTTREIARRELWLLSKKKPRKPKRAQVKQTDVPKSSEV